jgi:hypothetical protein
MYFVLFLKINKHDTFCRQVEIMIVKIQKETDRHRDKLGKTNKSYENDA